MGERPCGSVLEVAFRYRHGCHVGQLSERHPDVLIAQWCNFHVEVLEVHTRDARRIQAMVKELTVLAGREAKLLASDLDGGDVQLVQVPCPHQRGAAIGTLIEQHGCLYLQPLLYHEGWERYRILAFEEGQLRALFQALAERGEVELLTKRAMKGGLLNRVFMIPANELLAGLTGKQARALLDAVERGYYKVPRGTRFEDIAKARGVPRTTFEEHVRKGEGKVLTAVAPYLAMVVREREVAGLGNGAPAPAPAPTSRSEPQPRNPGARPAPRRPAARASPARGPRTGSRPR